jgi:tetratricopeptide (TPR) repeat protein
LRGGDLRAAERSLKDARVIEPNSFLLARRHCQVLTELGQQQEALDACRVALTKSTAMDQRAFVGALMASGAPARPRELVQAVREAVASRRLQNQPFSDAALCEVAHHIGDEAMLDLCVEGLQGLAPNNFETLRWQAVRRRSPAWALWLGWGALGAAVLATLANVLWRWLRRPAKTRGPAVAATALFLIAAGFAPGARAEDAAEPHGEHWQLSRFPINHAEPEKQIPSIEERNKDPLQFGYFLQDLNNEAVKAERLGDWRAALRYWRADALAVPDMAIGFGKACRAYQMLGELEHAIEFCSRALNRDGATVEDYLRYAELVTSRPVALSQLEAQDLDAIIKHLREEEQPGPAAVVECREAVKLDDVARLQSCTAVLAKLSPADPHTLTFQWSLAMLRRDYRQAQGLLAAMEKTGMNRQALAQARATTALESAWWRRLLTDWRYALALLVSLAASVGGLFMLRRRLSRFEPAAALSSGA